MLLLARGARSTAARSVWNTSRTSAWTRRGPHATALASTLDYSAVSSRPSSRSKILQPDASVVHPPLANYVHGRTVPLFNNRGKTLVVTSGQLGMDVKGHIPSDAAEQTRIIFCNLRAILQQAGGDLSDIVKLTAYVTDRSHMQGYMKARDEYLGEHQVASTLVIVSGFSKPEFLVEVEALAAVPTTASNGAKASVPPHWRKKRNSKPFGTPQRRSVHTAPSPNAVHAFCHELRQEYGIDVLASMDDDENSLREIKRRSRDFYWYSPILKPKLRQKRADALVLVASESDVVHTAKVAVKHGIPITTRGAGTGNYGQAVPLYGGAILDMSRLNKIEELDAHHGTVTVQAGAILADVENATRASGWELRQHPSTRQQATVGGFVAGGSTGHGALRAGGLSEDGAILAVRVVTAEAEPRILELQAPDVAPVVHAYGTNGIITAVQLPLARAQPWVDSTFVFATLADAAAFALETANAPAIVARAVTVFQAPVADSFLNAAEFLHDAARAERARDGGVLPDEQHVCIVQCASTSIGPVERLAAQRKGVVTQQIPSEKASRPFYENGWNHTTLHALKYDKSTTYLQALVNPETALDLVAKAEETFDTSELLQHLEVINVNGRMGFASLALLWPQGDDQESKNTRLVEILKWHEQNGFVIFDPHTYILEDGGMKETDWAQLGFKRRVDEHGILNPGKMKAWEEWKGDVNAIDAVSKTEDANETLTAAMRLADISKTSPLSDASRKNVVRAPRSRYWAEWTTKEFATADLSEAVAILPIGAVEAHGPHLPLGVDAMHNADLLNRSLDKLPDRVAVLALPAMEVGVSCEHARFAGTLELSAETAMAAWTEVGGCVARTGIRKLVLYNSHGGNQALAEVVARRLRERHGMMCILAMNIAQGLTPTNPAVSDLFPMDEVRYGIHGGDVETSLMMHLRPHLVDQNEAENFASRARDQPTDAALQMHAVGFANKAGWMSQDLNVAGVVGDAARSDADKGSILARACVDGFVELLVEVHDMKLDDFLNEESRFPPQGSI